VKKVKVGIIGFGTVGAGTASSLLKNADIIADRTGIKLELCKIADLDIVTDRGIDLPAGILTTDAEELINDVDVVVELIGGTGIAKDLILKALKQSKPVVTANKALIATHGEELFAAAEQSEADIYYEASVAGGIPVIKALREGFAGNRIEKIVGIMNGTCNYILTKMENTGVGFEEVLKEAQELGYAEADPTFDIDGIDTAHKTAILASLAYGEWFGLEPVMVEGIRNLQLCDIKYADEFGYRIKLLGIIKQEKEDVQIRVHPALIKKSTLLADVSDVFNAVMIKGDPVGETLFYGKGAGMEATSSAVVADIIDVALNLKYGSHRRVPAFRIGKQFEKVVSQENIISRYYVRLTVLDRPGVVAAVSQILGDNNISISSMLQKETSNNGEASLLILTHEAKEGSVKESIDQIEALDCVKDKAVLLRVEDL
jgi:homoserine dehydrogenase